MEKVRERNGLIGNARAESCRGKVLAWYGEVQAFLGNEVRLELCGWVFIAILGIWSS
jgi:hypothetical protein